VSVASSPPSCLGTTFPLYYFPVVLFGDAFAAVLLGDASAFAFFGDALAPVVPGTFLLFVMRSIDAMTTSRTFVCSLGVGSLERPHQGTGRNRLEFPSGTQLDCERVEPAPLLILVEREHPYNEGVPMVEDASL